MIKLSIQGEKKLMSRSHSETLHDRTRLMFSPAPLSKGSSARHTVTGFLMRFGFAMVAGLSAFANSAGAEEKGDSNEAAEPSGLGSLLDIAPGAFTTGLRYPKFYSDRNMNRDTVDGSLRDRQYLLGSLGGARDRWAANGFLFSAGITQTIQGVVDGAGEDGTTRFQGSADLYFGIDTGRAGWWSNGLIIAHAEGNWDNPVSDTGALLPLNGDGTMPGTPSSFALSEFYLSQSLPNNFSLVAGKLSATAYADRSFFANNERSQFLYEGLINNPILGSFVPYTTWGALLTKEINPTFEIVGALLANNTNATTLGLDDLDVDELTAGLVFAWKPQFGGKPGSYSMILGYTNKDTVAFDVDERYFLEEIIGTVPVAEKDSNHAIVIGGSQYLSINQSARRSDGQPVGFGPFFRMGFAPSDRNAIAQFYSIGLGGNGGILNRHDDNWGIGVAYTSISDDLRDDLDALNNDVDSHETVVEAFYNLAWTPAIRTSLNVQYVDSADPSLDSATVLAVRLQLDF